MRLIETLSRSAAEELCSRIDDILAEGSQIAQFHQSNEPGHDFIVDELAKIVVGQMKSVINACATVCERRASVEERHQSIRSEATKCAAQIRHELLCDDGESICLTCEGSGVIHGQSGGTCHRCNGRGVRVYETEVGR